MNEPNLMYNLLFTVYINYLYKSINTSLQTLNSISAEKNSTIIFPLPIDFISHFLKDKNDKDGKED